MSDASQQPAGPGPGGQAVRYEATVHSTSPATPLDAVADLDLDRVPDAEGTVRLLVSAEEAEQLVSRGYEVRLHAAVPVAPLDPSLVMSDEQAAAWLDERLGGIEGEEGA
jgi:hypothetical protein